VSSPIFVIRVLAKSARTVRLDVRPLAEEDGFDVESRRDVLRAVGYGGDFMFPDGRIAYDWEEQSVLARTIDFASELWNDAWIDAHAARFVSAAVLVESTPATTPSPRWAADTYAAADEWFADSVARRFVVDVTVTDEPYLAHLDRGTIYAFY
jgi:hypothetical protein